LNVILLNVTLLKAILLTVTLINVILRSVILQNVDATAGDVEEPLLKGKDQYSRAPH
jgi:hypothetical protein